MDNLVTTLCVAASAFVVGYGVRAFRVSPKTLRNIAEGDELKMVRDHRSLCFMIFFICSKYLRLCSKM